MLFDVLSADSECSYVWPWTEG